MIKERLISALLSTMLFVIFLPFGLEHFGWMRWLLLAGVGAITTFSCVVAELAVRYVFRMPHAPENGMQYMVRRNMFFSMVNMLMFLPIMMFYLDRFVNNDVVDNHASWSLLIKLLLVFAGVSLVISMYWKNVYWKRHYAKELQDAWRINGMLEERQRTASATPVPCAGDDEKTVTISGSTKESVAFKPSAFLYAVSEGNYVHIYYLRDGAETSAMIRTRMKEMEECCASTPLMRCHRAYIVNPQHVVRVVSRSSGFMLELRHTDTLVPVSRTYTASIRERLANPSHAL
ncbi:MAG: LytTR family DNA-binding domain-containing protein [Prevotella sp.]